MTTAQHAFEANPNPATLARLRAEQDAAAIAAAKAAKAEADRAAAARAALEARRDELESITSFARRAAIVDAQLARLSEAYAVIASVRAAIAEEHRTAYEQTAQLVSVMRELGETSTPICTTVARHRLLRLAEQAKADCDWARKAFLDHVRAGAP